MEGILKILSISKCNGKFEDGMTSGGKEYYKKPIFKH